MRDDNKLSLNYQITPEVAHALMRIEGAKRELGTIVISPSHNYYLGRAEADITQWVEYFCLGMAVAFENVIARVPKNDSSPHPRILDPMKRKSFELFLHQETISAKNISTLFGITQRAANTLCKKWLQEGFLILENPSKKGRSYRLSSRFSSLNI